MSKSNTKPKPVVMLIEASPQTKHLMLKRRRLFVMGPSIPVRSLPCPDKSQAWLNASIEKSVDATVWDMAHDLATRVKKELGQSVFIEPDKGESSRFATLHIPKRKKNTSTKAAMNALLGRKGKGASSSAANFLGMSGNMPGGASPGMFGVNSMPGMSGLPGMASMMPPLPDPLADVLPAGVMEALSIQEELKSPQGEEDECEESKIVCDALASLPDWQNLELPRRQMFEAEAKQLFAYLKSQPASGLERSVGIVTQLVESQFSSNALKSFLVRASESKTESGMTEQSA